jgi:ribose transport system substrate-binding protein
MKKILVYIICLNFIAPGIILPQDPARKTDAKKFSIGLIGKSQSNPLFMSSFAGAKVAAKEIGAKYNIEIFIDWQTPQNESPLEQAEAIERMSRSGVAGIGISCTNPKILTPLIDKVVDQGIPVVCFDSDAPKSKRLAYYGANNAGLGKSLMMELAREMNETGIVAVIGGNKNASNLQTRIQAVQEELKKHPSMKLLPNGIFYHEETPEKAAEVMNRAQKANPEIGGWVLVGGWPLFAENALKSIPGEVKIVACDALPAELEYVKDGHVQVLIAQGSFLWGYKSVELLINKILFDEKPMDEFVTDPPTRVTKDNLNEWTLKWNKWLLKEAVYGR